MTSIERSETLIAELKRRIDREIEDFLFDVDKAITAAVAEDRASRECCKVEREACAKIAE